MRFSNKILILILLIFYSILSMSAYAFNSIRWDMQSTWGSQVAINGESAVYFSKKIREISDGKIVLRFHEPNALAPSLELWDAVKNGKVDAGYTTPGYHAGKIPAVSFFTSVPFGPNFSEYIGWFKYGGGQELRDQIYGYYGLKSFNCFAQGPETGGWFKQRINSVADLRGMKKRFFGLGAMVMWKLGVETQLLAGVDIYPALQQGKIDATEFSMPMHDLSYGFYQIAKFNYYPGWHQQISLGELLLNKQKWERLTNTQKSLIKVACDATLLYSKVRSDEKSAIAMQDLKRKGVTFVRWSNEDLAKMKIAWNEVLKEKSASDPLFRKVAESYLNYRKKIKIVLKYNYLN